jgi:hypothetical protein
MIADKIEALLADKGYDADAIREELAKAEVEAVIPPARLYHRLVLLEARTSGPPFPPAAETWARTVVLSML